MSLLAKREPFSASKFIFHLSMRFSKTYVLQDLQLDQLADIDHLGACPGVLLESRYLSNKHVISKIRVNAHITLREQSTVL